MAVAWAVTRLSFAAALPAAGGPLFLFGGGHEAFGEGGKPFLGGLGAPGRLGPGILGGLGASGGDGGVLFGGGRRAVGGAAGRLGFLVGGAGGLAFLAGGGELLA